MRKQIKKLIYRIVSRLIEGSERYNFLHSLSVLNATVPANFIIGRYPVIKADGRDIDVQLGSGVEIRNYFSLYLGNKAILTLSDGVFFNNSCSINCQQGVAVGENTIFGEGVKIYDHNHAFERGQRLIIHKNKFTSASVVIGKNCWIGSNVTILAGVEIGNNVIVGANNLIYKSILSDTIIKARVEYVHSGLQ